MLKTGAAIAAMLKEQKDALETEMGNRLKRDEALIETIKADTMAFMEPIVAMVQNLDRAIKLIEGTQEVTHG